jgi:hypothetical protein
MGRHTYFVLDASRRRCEMCSAIRREVEIESRLDVFQMFQFIRSDR